jgi:hypothetical protein
MYGLTPEQVEELREKSLNARRDLSTAITRSYARAVVPVRGDSTSGATSYRLELVDLRTMLSAGRGLRDLVLEALSHRVFDRLAVTKLIDLSGLETVQPHLAQGSDLADLGDLGSDLGRRRRQATTTVRRPRRPRRQRLPRSN